jgi:hypothetical protein
VGTHHPSAILSSLSFSSDVMVKACLLFQHQWVLGAMTAGATAKRAMPRQLSCMVAVILRLKPYLRAVLSGVCAAVGASAACCMLFAPVVL